MKLSRVSLEAVPEELGWVLLIPEICLPCGAFAAVMMAYGVIVHCCRRPLVPWTQLEGWNPMNPVEGCLVIPCVFEYHDAS